MVGFGADGRQRYELLADRLEHFPATEITRLHQPRLFEVGAPCRGFGVDGLGDRCKRKRGIALLRMQSGQVGMRNGERGIGLDRAGQIVDCGGRITPCQRIGAQVVQRGGMRGIQPEHALPGGDRGCVLATTHPFGGFGHQPGNRTFACSHCRSPSCARPAGPKVNIQPCGATHCRRGHLSQPHLLEGKPEHVDGCAGPWRCPFCWPLPASCR